jgi:translation initiation factor IF-3
LEVFIAQEKQRVNEEIRHPEVRLIGPDGQQLGVYTSINAFKKAQELGLDLIEIAPQAKPPVCKIIDFGKFQYEQQKKEKIQKKKQHVTVLKEIRLHPNTDTHDFDFKSRHAEKFLSEGNKVKVSVIFKGRELAYKEHGKELLIKFIQNLEEVSTVEHEIKFEGRAMLAILQPKKVKSKKTK